MLQVGDESLELAALRELEEETGYTAEKVQVVSIGPTSAGLTSERVAFVVAEGLTRVGLGGGVGDESIIIHEAPRSDIVPG